MARHADGYVIIGGGLAGATAVEGIREIDKSAPITLIGAERRLPYHRPPLSKKLWAGKKKVEDILVHDRSFYDGNNVQITLGSPAVAIDAAGRTVTDATGKRHNYRKLLIATGGAPRRLAIPGGDHEDVCYYRTLDDYSFLRERARPGATAVVVGGGFIGSEVAAALCANQVRVTLIFPGAYLCDRVFPESLGRAVTREFEQKGVEVLVGSRPVAFERNGDRFVTRTTGGRQVASDILVVGIGIEPEITLARSAGIRTGNGIVVDGQLRTGAPDIYAAGDNACFPYAALGADMRVEHWDNALNQGKLAGRNMAGANETYAYMPYFFSDLFEFGYEAVGDVRADLDIVADWQQENAKGVIYYLKDGRVRGAMMCNVWDKVPAARELILKGDKATASSLRGAIQ